MLLLCDYCWLMVVGFGYAPIVVLGLGVGFALVLLFGVYCWLLASMFVSLVSFVIDYGLFSFFCCCVVCLWV